jgi:PAS domain S-box-containing protein
MDTTPRIMDSPSAQEARLLALSPDLLGALGFDGRIKFVNPAWSRSLGIPEARLLSTPYLDLVHPDDRELTASAVDRLRGGERIAEFSCRLLRADGGDRCLLWSAQVSEADGCFYIAGKDISDRQAMELELAAHAERLERINAELQEFAYIASHDLAEPLRMITSYLELLQRRYAGQLDETADEFIGFAVGGAVRMRALIDDLLAYSRVGSHEMQRGPVDLEEIVKHVLHGLERAIEDTHATVEVAPELASPHCDATQLGQLLQNLIANGVKFHRPDVAPVVRVSSVPEDGGVRITVADNGIGIAEAQRERIFKMFARLHGRDEYDGTGIGLALVRRIAERHGGRVWVESDRDPAHPGSTFHVWLPS